MGTRVLEIVGASVFIGGIVGGSLFGHIADSFGRRLSLVIAFVLSSGGLAVAAQANAEYMLIIGHIITGLGIGGQITATIVLVQELSPRAMYGRMIAILEAFTGIGGLLGVLLAFAVAPQLEWRTTYLVTCGFVVYATVLHFTVPESPRWLDHVGRNYEALSIVEQIERSHRTQLPCDDIQSSDEMKTALVDDSDLESPDATSKITYPTKIASTLELWALWITATMSSYALGIYLPTLISLNGYSMFTSWTTIGLLNVAQTLGSLAAASVLDNYGRQQSLLVFTVLHSEIWENFAFVVGFIVLYRLLGLLALRFVNHQKK
ncbi:hypothetical protein PHYBOEH_001216 [Phytophthora boehmeriae]|uniref:Major facilitator superfamily (MFS) profile domain-containing protein n=1 Tax=Phytophthora boehmeriae TaxID=109152 RepID=A0A8T1V9L0_9STRA|nr:hypothetical protein PHYBOEH_001216 [Phytophthora boehmeriae]